MPKGRKRTQEEYEREIEEASKRIRKKKENIKTARTNATWQDYLIDVLGVSPKAVSNGKDFWESVRERTLEFDTKAIKRRSRYSELREVGFTAKEARRIRDWSEDRIELELARKTKA